MDVYDLQQGGPQQGILTYKRNGDPSSLTVEVTMSDSNNTVMSIKNSNGVVQWHQVVPWFRFGKPPSHIRLRRDPVQPVGPLIITTGDASDDVTDVTGCHGLVHT